MNPCTGQIMCTSVYRTTNLGNSVHIRLSVHFTTKVSTMLCKTMHARAKACTSVMQLNNACTIE